MNKSGRGAARRDTRVQERGSKVGCSRGYRTSALILEICVEIPRKSGEIVDVFRGLARAIYADTAPSTPISTFFGGLGVVAPQEKFLRRRFQANLGVYLRCLPRPPF